MEPRAHQYRHRARRANFDKRTNAEKFFEQAIAEQPNIMQATSAGRRVSQVYSATDFSYRNSQLTGDRWMLAGDAAGFIDPVFSSGVFLAMMSGEMCADIIDEALTNPKRERRLFARYTRQFNYAMDVYVRFVKRGTKRNSSKCF